MAAGDQTPETQRSKVAGDNSGITRLLGCNADGMLYTHPWSNFGVSQDLLANDSDKTFTVPANHLWIVNWIMVNYLATATAGNRDLVCNVLDDSANLLSRFTTGTTIIANDQRHIVWGGAHSTLNDASQQVIGGPFVPNLILLPGYQLRVFDFTAVDPAADDMGVTIGRQEIDNT